MQQVKNFKEKPSLQTKWLFLLLAILFVPHLAVSHDYYQQSLMTDLHLRIIGSRLLNEGRSPYFFQWKPGDDYRLFNPNSFIPNGLNGVTVTPTILWIQLPWAKIDYCSIKLMWWIIEELLMFAALFLTCSIPQKLGRQLLTILLAIVFFCFSRNWWVHVITGQYYILFGFAFALSAFTIKRNKTIALSVFPLTTLLRPFFAFATVSWLLNDTRRNFRRLLPSIALALLIIALSHKSWPEYSRAMSLYSNEILGWQINNVNDYRHVNVPFENCVYRIQGNPTLGAGCLFSLQHYLKLVHVFIATPLFFTCCLIAFLLLLVLFTGRKRLTATAESILLTSFLIYIFCELFTPANRNPYNLVQYLGVLGLLVSKATKTSAIILVIGLAFNHDWPFRFIYQRELGEGLMLLSIYLTLLQIRPLKEENSVYTFPYFL